MAVFNIIRREEANIQNTIFCVDRIPEVNRERGFKVLNAKVCEDNSEVVFLEYEIKGKIKSIAISFEAIKKFIGED